MNNKLNKRLLKIRQAQHKLYNQKQKDSYRLKTLRKLSKHVHKLLESLFGNTYTPELAQQFMDTFMYEVEEVIREKQERQQEQETLYFDTLQLIDNCKENCDFLPIGGEKC